MENQTLKYTPQELQEGFKVYEYYLINEYKSSPQTLNEIKLKFKGLKGLGKDLIKKFSSLSTPEQVFIGVAGKLNKITDKDPQSIVKFIKSKAKEYKGKSLKDIKADSDKLYTEFTGNKIDEASGLARRVGGFIALLLYLGLNIVPNIVSSSNALLGDAPSMETPVDLDSNDNPDALDFSDIDDFSDTDDSSDTDDTITPSSLGGDIAFRAVIDAVIDQDIKLDIDTKTIGGAISFDTGEFEANEADINEAAQDAVDDLLDVAKDGVIKSININPFGLVSNTPGDQDNNPNGPGSDGLDQNRLDNAGKPIAEKMKEILQDKYPDADINITDGSLNGDSVDGQKEVAKGSKEAQFSQVGGAYFSDIDFEDGGDDGGDQDQEDDTNDKPLPAQARLIDPKLGMIDMNIVSLLLVFFLPLLIDDYDDVIDSLVKASNRSTDKEITRKEIEEILKNIASKSNPDEDDKIAYKVYKWVVSTSRNPSRLGNNLKKLDPKIDLQDRKDVSQPYARTRAGSRMTQGNTGAQRTSPRVSTQVVENVLIESTNFNNIPNYNAAKAKSNLGILVPLYAYIWSGGENFKGEILPVDFDIDYVMSTYRDSWGKFERDYPIINYFKRKEDDKGKPTPPDAAKVIEAILNNKALLAKFSKINTKEELQELILAILAYTNKGLQQKQPVIMSTLFKLRNQIKEGDVDDVVKVLEQYKNLTTYLDKINTPEELSGVLKVIIDNVNDSLKSQPQAIKGAIVGAGNQLKKVSSNSKNQTNENINYKAKRLSEVFGGDPIDYIKMNVPLFLRALEYAREDAETDLDLHTFTEKAIALTKSKGTLDMRDYAVMITEARTKKGKKVNPKYLKGLKSKGKYGSKDAMKKEIDKFSGTKTYQKDWKADYNDSGKRIKTKPSAATKAYNRMFNETLNESQITTALKNKSDKSGIPVSILRQVYNKGKAAWNTGHRPGSSQDQWAMGRVNSFITGSGGARKADKELWDKAKKAKAKNKNKKK